MVKNATHPTRIFKLFSQERDIATNFCCLTGAVYVREGRKSVSGLPTPRPKGKKAVVTTVIL